MTRPVLDWTDFDWFVTHWPPAQVIPTLRQAATQIETITGERLDVRSGDKKAFIIDKIQLALRKMRTNNDLPRYQQVRQRLEDVGKGYPQYNPDGRRYNPAPPIQTPTFGGVPGPSRPATTAPRYNAYDPPAGYRPSPAASASRPGGSGGWSSSAGVSNAYSGRAPGQVHTLQDWKANPLWKPLVAVTGMEALPDMSVNDTAHAKKTKRQTFYLSTDVAQKLYASKTNPAQAPHYSLRIFCTSNEYYGPSGYYPGRPAVINRNIPIEYPNNPDVLFDNSVVQFKERGLRGKAGSSPPFDLCKNPAFMPNGTRLYNLDFSHTGPTTGKKKDVVKRFYFQVVLAEMITKDELLAKLMQLKPGTIDEALADARRRAEDEDIVAGDTKMTLKDPLSYMRITQPIRSKLCTHIQCFDAKWWIESNAQHPQFLCPLCSKALSVDDLIVDGYFMSILNAVPDSVEDVIVDSDFKWRTEDGKYSSDSPAQRLPDNGLPTPISDAKPEGSRAPSTAPSTSAVATGKRKAIEILSSDDDEEGSFSRASRPEPMRTPSASASVSVPPPVSNGVIDLTLDSDDDEDEEQEQFFPPPGAGTGRDAVDSTRQPLPPIRVSEAGSSARLKGDSHVRDDAGEHARTHPNEAPRSAYQRPPLPRPRPQLPDTFSLDMDDFDLHSALYPVPRHQPDPLEYGSGSKGPQLGTWDRPKSFERPAPAVAVADRWNPDQPPSKRGTTPYNDWLVYDDELQNGDRLYSRNLSTSTLPSNSLKLLPALSQDFGTVIGTVALPPLPHALPAPAFSRPSIPPQDTWCPQDRTPMTPRSSARDLLADFATTVERKLVALEAQRQKRMMAMAPDLGAQSSAVASAGTTGVSGSMPPSHPIRAPVGSDVPIPPNGATAITQRIGVAELGKIKPPSNVPANLTPSSRSIWLLEYIRPAPKTVRKAQISGMLAERGIRPAVPTSNTNPLGVRPPSSARSEGFGSLSTPSGKTTTAQGIGRSNMLTAVPTPTMSGTHRVRPPPSFNTSEFGQWSSNGTSMLAPGTGQMAGLNPWHAAVSPGSPFSLGSQKAPCLGTPAGAAPEEFGPWRPCEPARNVTLAPTARVVDQSLPLHRCSSDDPPSVPACASNAPNAIYRDHHRLTRPFAPATFAQPINAEDVPPSTNPAETIEAFLRDHYARMTSLYGLPKANGQQSRWQVDAGGENMVTSVSATGSDGFSVETASTVNAVDALL